MMLEKKSHQPEPTWTDNLPWLWFVALAIYCVVHGTLMFAYWDDLSKFGTFGDSFGTLNAFASSLALAGAVYAVLLQRKELKLQREVSLEAKEEMAKSALAQQQTVEAMKAQVEHFRQVATYEKQRYSDSLFMQMINEDMTRKKLLAMKFSSALDFQQFKFKRFGDDDVSHDAKAYLLSVIKEMNGLNDGAWRKVIKGRNRTRAVQANSKIFVSTEMETLIDPNEAFDAFRLWFAFLENVAFFHVQNPDCKAAPVWYTVLIHFKELLHAIECARVSLQASHADRVITLSFDTRIILAFWRDLYQMYGTVQENLDDRQNEGEKCQIDELVYPGGNTQRELD